MRRLEQEDQRRLFSEYLAQDRELTGPNPISEAEIIELYGRRVTLAMVGARLVQQWEANTQGNFNCADFVFRDTLHEPWMQLGSDRVNQSLRFDTQYFLEQHGYQAVDVEDGQMPQEGDVIAYGFVVPFNRTQVEQARGATLTQNPPITGFNAEHFAIMQNGTARSKIGLRDIVDHSPFIIPMHLGTHMQIFRRVAQPA